MCVDCQVAESTARSPRCAPCRDAHRKRLTRARVDRYQASQRGITTIEAYRRSPARAASLRRYNASDKARAFDAIRAAHRHAPVAPLPPMPLPWMGDEIFDRAREATGNRPDLF